MSIKSAYLALGSVYGDIGTSPLYALAAIFPDGAPSDRKVLLGTASVIFWTIAIVVAVKYLAFTLAANDHGEGGIVALWAIICRATGLKASASSRPHDTDEAVKRLDIRGRVSAFTKFPALGATLLGVVMIASNLVLSDGILTPAISVISAVEGMVVEHGGSQSVATLVSAVVLLLLFSIQRFGTARVSAAFSPVMLAWFATIGGIGLYNAVTHDPSAFAALSPHYAYYFFAGRSTEAWKQLGAVLLCVTGAEALFADMGHFGRSGVTLGFLAVVWPSLTLSYIGQTAFLLESPEASPEVFWRSIPEPIFWPVAVLAFFAAVLASQAMITASFTAVDQAAKFDVFPRVDVVHTNGDNAFQVYSPSVNWLLFLGSFAVVVGFGSSAKISEAYGLAVALVMFLDTALVAIVMRCAWEWHVVPVAAFWTFFSFVTGAILSSAAVKIPTGAWFPLLVTVALTTVSVAWRRGRVSRVKAASGSKLTLEDFTEPRGKTEKGFAIHYTATDETVPETLKIASHDVTVLLTNRRLSVPTVDEDERFAVQRMERAGFYRVLARYGYVDSPAQGADFADSLIEELMEFAEKPPEDVEAGSTGVAKWFQRSMSVPMDETTSLPTACRDVPRALRSCLTEAPKRATRRRPIPDFSGAEDESTRIKKAADAGVSVFAGRVRLAERKAPSFFGSALDGIFDTLEKIAFNFVEEYRIVSKNLVTVTFFK